MNTHLTAILVVVVALATGCAHQASLHQMNPESGFIASASPEESRIPTILVEAHPRVGFAPLRVSFKAVLSSVPGNDQAFACLWESWTFGDGAVSSEKKNCAPDTAVNTEFFGEHVYRDAGLYELRFVLGNNQLTSRPVLVRVLGRNN
jgi:hypothetical protein